MWPPLAVGHSCAEGPGTAEGPPPPKTPTGWKALLPQVLPRVALIHSLMPVARASHSLQPPLWATRA